MSTIIDEQTIGLPDVARSLPLSGRGGKPPSLSSILRWILVGVTGPDGKRVGLEAIRCGGRWITSREAIARWCERLTPRLHPDPQLPPRTPTQRERAQRRAGKVLDQAGI